MNRNGWPTWSGIRKELKRAVSGPEIDRQKINILLQALCDGAELDTTRKEMVFRVRHSEAPVVIAWEA